MNLVQYRSIREKDFMLCVKTEHFDKSWLVDSGKMSQQNTRRRDFKCDSWGTNVLWIQKPGVLFCLFFFLPVLTIQLLSAGNVQGVSLG